MFWTDESFIKSEPYKVLLKRGEFVDDSRGGRVVAYKLYYPSDYTDGKVPVIVWSHGYGGSRDGAGFISRYITSHGYVVVHPNHAGSDSSLWEGKPGHPWDVLRKKPITREMTVERFGDIPFLLDQLPDFAVQNPDVGQVMDLSTLGMSGHSFGAMTTQAMSGQKFPSGPHEEAGMLVDFREERFKAAIAYSPVPIRELTGEAPEKHFYGPISLPVFYMTGTKDDSPLEGFTYDRRVVIHEHTGQENKYLLVLEGGDHMVFNGTRGKLEANDLRGQHEELIQILSLAFWEAYLKGNKKALDWLNKGGAEDYVGTAGRLKTP